MRVSDLSPALSLVQHFVRNFVNESCQGFGWLHVRQYANQTAVRDATGGADPVGILEFDLLGLNKLNQSRQRFADIAVNGVAQFWQLLAFGL